MLALVDYEVSRTRQAAGLGRQRLRMAIPPHLPEALAVEAAAGLRAAAVAAEVDVVWLEMALDAEFSLVGIRRAGAGLGWLTAGPDTLPAPLDAMVLGEFEPEIWVPLTHGAAGRGTIQPGGTGEHGRHLRAAPRGSRHVRRVDQGIAGGRSAVQVHRSA